MKRLFTLFLTMIIFAGLSINAKAQDSVMVKFTVDVSTWADTTSNIDLDNDSLYISGGAWEWPTPGANHDLMLMDDDNDSIYTFYQKMGKLDTTEYKFFRVPAGEGSSWDYGEAEGTNNRKLIAYGNDGDTLMSGDTWGIYATEVQFNVDMVAFADTTDFAYGEDSVFVTGSPWGWTEPGTNPAQQMYDMDEDSVFSYTLFQDTLAATDYEYKYFYVPSEVASSWDYGEWQGGENRKLTVGAEMMTLNEMWGKFNINFYVTEDGSTALEGADITISDKTKTTDAEGHAVFYSFPVDSVAYTVSHADYEDYSWGVAINYDHVDVMVDMSTASIGDDHKQVHFNMYPNPSSNVLNIEGLKDVTRVEVYNTVGQQVSAIDNVKKTVKINTSRLETGIYFVNFYNKKGVVSTQKFMKQ